MLGSSILRWASPPLHVFTHLQMQTLAFSIVSLSVAILICSGYYNKIPLTGMLINNKNLFLRILETGSPRSGCQWVESETSGCRFLLVSSHGRRTWASSLEPFITFYKGTDPFLRAELSWPNHSRVSPPNTITLGVRIFMYEFGGEGTRSDQSCGLCYSNRYW